MTEKGDKTTKKTRNGHNDTQKDHKERDYHIRDTTPQRKMHDYKVTQNNESRRGKSCL